MNGKETRTITTTGGAACVTLPRWWMNYYDVKPGNKVDLTIKDNKIIIEVIKEGE